MTNCPFYHKLKDFLQVFLQFQKIPWLWGEHNSYKPNHLSLVFEATEILQKSNHQQLPAYYSSPLSTLLAASSCLWPLNGQQSAWLLRPPLRSIPLTLLVLIM